MKPLYKISIYLNIIGIKFNFLLQDKKLTNFVSVYNMYVFFFVFINPYMAVKNLSCKNPFFFILSITPKVIPHVKLYFV